jgi:pimeloyl-ACP methyl ester carboxylesterase
MISGFPDVGDSDALQARTTGRVLSMVGENDGLVTAQQVTDGVALFNGAVSTSTSIVPGMTHYQFTDDATDDELEKEGTTGTVDTATGRANALAVIDAFLANARLAGAR